MPRTAPSCRKLELIAEPIAEARRRQGLDGRAGLHRQGQPDAQADQQRRRQPVRAASAAIVPTASANTAHRGRPEQRAGDQHAAEADPAGKLAGGRARR